MPVMSARLVAMAPSVRWETRALYPTLSPGANRPGGWSLNGGHSVTTTGRQVRVPAQEAAVRVSPVLALPVLFASVAVLAQPVSATWIRETQPTPRSGANAVQDVALWVNPADAGSSLLLTADIQTGLVTFRLDGQEKE